MFFNRAPVNPFSRALSCGFSTELLLAYRALGGRHGNMVLCVLFTRASYHNKVPSTICTASALSSTLRGSSIDGTFKVRSVAFVHFENLQSDLFSLSWNTAMATSVNNRGRGVGNKWGWDVTTARDCWWEALASTNWPCCCWIRFQRSTPSVCGLFPGRMCEICPADLLYIRIICSVRLPCP